MFQTCGSGSRFQSTTIEDCSFSGLNDSVGFDERDCLAAKYPGQRSLNTMHGCDFSTAELAGSEFLWIDMANVQLPADPTILVIDDWASACHPINGPSAIGLLDRGIRGRDLITVRVLHRCGQLCPSPGAGKTSRAVRRELNRPLSIGRACPRTESCLVGINHRSTIDRLRPL